jgi:predicted membrane channel-forming protein YqfA (hemolysin III family)
MISTPILLVAAFHHRDLPFLIGTITFSTTMLLVYLRYRRLAMTLYLGTGWLGLMLIRQLALTIPLSSVLVDCRRHRFIRQALYSLRTSACVMAISSGICSCLPVLAVTLRRGLFAQCEKRRVQLDKLACAAD